MSSNPLLNEQSVKEYVDTSFQENALISNRKMHLKKMAFIKKNINQDLKLKEHGTKEVKKPMSFQ